MLIYQTKSLLKGNASLKFCVICVVACFPKPILNHENNHAVAPFEFLICCQSLCTSGIEAFQISVNGHCIIIICNNIWTKNVASVFFSGHVTLLAVEDVAQFISHIFQQILVAASGTFAQNIPWRSPLGQDHVIDFPSSMILMIEASILDAEKTDLTLDLSL